MSDFFGKFNTSLPLDKESQFNSWLAAKSKETGRDLSQQIADYDLRGFWLNGGADWKGGHMPDTYKKPNHPTFSDESIWSGTTGPGGAKYVGGKWIGSDKTGWSYQPSKEMLRNGTHNVDQLMEYMAENEPGVEIIWPD